MIFLGYDARDAAHCQALTDKFTVCAPARDSGITTAAPPYVCHIRFSGCLDTKLNAMLEVAGRVAAIQLFSIFVWRRDPNALGG